MKKFIALILSCTLLFGCIASVSVAGAEIETTETKEALSLLEYIGIAKEDEDLSLNVTRAELASYVAKAIKAESTGGKPCYNDVESDFWAFDVIMALTQLGYFSGEENKSFRPNDNVTFNEAIKVIVSMAGYGPLAEAKGGFPTGYLQVAKRLRITDGIANEIVTKEDVYIMMYRAMNCALYSPTVFSEGEVKYEANENENILSVYHDIYYVEGTVNGAGMISLNSSSAVDEGEVVIGEDVYRTDEIPFDMYDYLGMTIKGYYIKHDGEDAGLIAVFPYGKENNIISFNRTELVGKITDEGQYYMFKYFDENDKIDSIKIPRGCIVIKNGVSVTDDLFNELTITKGIYRFLDHDGDNKTDVLFINEYYNLIVGAIENKEGMLYIETDNNTEYYRGAVGSKRVIYDKFDSEKSIDLTEASDKIIKFKNADGSLASINDIVVSDVLSIYKSEDEKYIEVTKGKGTVKGTVSTIYNPDGEVLSVVINDVSYDMDKSIAEDFADILKAGFTGVFYLDAFGEIGYFVSDKDASVLFGYLVDTTMDEVGFKEKNVYLKIFSQNGTLDVYTADEKIRLDGEPFDDGEKIYNYLTSHRKQMIRFSADENKIVTYVDTTVHNEEKEGEKSIAETLPYARYSYSATKTSFSQTELMVTKSDTMVFVVPTDDVIESGTYSQDDFVIKQRKNFIEGGTYYASAYRVDPHGAYEDIILVKSNDAAFNQFSYNVPAMISKVELTIDENGDEIYLLTVYETELPKQYKTVNREALDGYDLKKGDLVFFSKDINGRITSVVDVLVKSGDKIEFNIAKSATNNTDRYYSKTISVGADGNLTYTNSTAASSFCVAYGYAGRVSENVISFAYTKNDCKEENYIFKKSLGSYSVIVYDREGGKDGNIYWSSPSDIVDYQMSGEDCTDVVLFLRQGAVRGIYVYK